jgi:hypothetical protein
MMDSDNDGDGDDIIMVGDVEAESHDDNDDDDDDDDGEEDIGSDDDEGSINSLPNFSSCKDDEIDIENVEKFILTFSTGDYDDEFDDILNADRSDIVPDWPTQASYNKTDNWKVRNQIGLEKVRGQLQTCI